MRRFLLAATALTLVAPASAQQFTRSMLYQQTDLGIIAAPRSAGPLLTYGAVNPTIEKNMFTSLVGSVGVLADNNGWSGTNTFGGTVSFAAPVVFGQNLLPATGSFYNIGSALVRWANGYYDALTVGGSAVTSIATTAPGTGVTTALGAAVNGASGLVTYGGTFAGSVAANLVPTVDNTDTLGGVSYRWSNLYAARVTRNADIATGGSPTINTGTCTTVGTQVGGTTAGTFKMSASCATGTTVILSGFYSTTGWSCFATDRTQPTSLFNETAATGTSATLTISGVATGTADVIQFACTGY